jgi:hypothetical protein
MGLGSQLRGGLADFRWLRYYQWSAPGDSIVWAAGPYCSGRAGRF